MDRIVCITTEYIHRHLICVGVGTFAGQPSRRFTLAEVRHKLDGGDTFYTVSPSTGRRTDVYKDTCGIGGCSVETIRSKVDALDDNILDNLNACP